MRVTMGGLHLVFESDIKSSFPNYRLLESKVHNTSLIEQIHLAKIHWSSSKQTSTSEHTVQKVICSCKGKECDNYNAYIYIEDIIFISSIYRHFSYLCFQFQNYKYFNFF